MSGRVFLGISSLMGGITGQFSVPWKYYFGGCQEICLQYNTSQELCIWFTPCVLLWFSPGWLYPYHLTHWPLGNLNTILGTKFSKKNSVINGWGISCELALRWTSFDLTDKSTLAQVMAWCRQATSHYLSQCWPRSMLQNGVTRPQWVNSLWHCITIWWYRCGSTLVQVMACGMRAPSAVLTWTNDDILSIGTFGNKLQSNFDQNIKLFIEKKNALKSLQNNSNLFNLQCVKEVNLLFCLISIGMVAEPSTRCDLAKIHQTNCIKLEIEDWWVTGITLRA